MMTHALESHAHKRISEIGILSHRYFQEVFNLSLSMLQNIQPGRVLALVGPSRAGKSQLLKMLINALLAGIRPHRDDDVPILRLEADLGNQQRMSLKELTAEALQELRHPVFTDFANLLDGHPQTVARLPEHTLRPMFIKALQARGTIYLIVDEAHHLLMTARHKLQSDILDALKNICNKADVVLVLIGGYALLKGLFHSAHFNGRLELLHFPPYTESDEDMTEYASLLHAFERALTLSEPNMLVSHAAEIRKIYWGTFGATIDGIREAESRRIARKADALEMRDILATRLPAPAMRVVDADIQFGLDFFKVYADDAQASALRHDVHTPEKTTDKATASSRSKPFKKNPVRRAAAKMDIK